MQINYTRISINLHTIFFNPGKTVREIYFCTVSLNGLQAETYGISYNQTNVCDIRIEQALVLVFKNSSNILFNRLNVSLTQDKFQIYRNKNQLFNQSIDNLLQNNYFIVINIRIIIGTSCSFFSVSCEIFQMCAPLELLWLRIYTSPENIF